MKTLEAKSLVLLHHHLKALRLPTVGSECEKVARQAAADNVDHLSYLLQLLELELLDREKRAAERRLKATMPTMCSLPLRAAISSCFRWSAPTARQDGAFRFLPWTRG